MSFAAPNHTQTPNALYDLMPEMGRAELRVTLAILYEGGKQDRGVVRLRHTDLEDATGLSHGGVASGIQRGMERGIIKRMGAQGSYAYWLNLPASS